MPDDPQRDEPDETSEAAELPEAEARRRAAAERRRRRDLDEVFGDVLPEVTRDEAADPADDPVAGRGAQGDEWLRANRPPHHDDRG